MTKVRARGKDVRRFILDKVGAHPRDISRLVADHFGISRQAVNKHLQKLTAEHALEESGKTRSRTYKLSPLVEWRGRYEITPGLAEDQVWTRDIRQMLDKMPGNVMDIWHYGFTEMFNNALDHSGGGRILIEIRKTAVSTEMLLMDDGVGIFRKIKQSYRADNQKNI